MNSQRTNYKINLNTEQQFELKSITMQSDKGSLSTNYNKKNIIYASLKRIFSQRDYNKDLATFSGKINADLCSQVSG